MAHTVKIVLFYYASAANVLLCLSYKLYHRYGCIGKKQNTQGTPWLFMGQYFLWFQASSGEHGIHSPRETRGELLRKCQKGDRGGESDGGGSHVILCEVGRAILR